MTITRDMAAVRPRYTVLSETDGMHLVVVRHGALPWMRVVAAFPNKARADAYADIENEFTGEDACWPDDLKYDPPADEEPASALSALLGQSLAHEAPLERLVSGITDDNRREEFPGESHEDDADAVLSAGVSEASQDATAVTPAPAQTVAPDSQAAAGIQKFREEMAGRNETIRQMYRNGKSQGEIARAYGVTKGRIWQICRDIERAKPDEEYSEKYSEPAEATKSESPADLSTEPVPASEPVSRDGIVIDPDKITVGDRSMPLTETQSRLLSILLKAAPNPVSRTWIYARLWKRAVKIDEADIRAKPIIGDLQRGQRLIGLGLARLGPDIASCVHGRDGMAAMTSQLQLESA